MRSLSPVPVNNYNKIPACIFRWKGSRRSIGRRAFSARSRYGCEPFSGLLQTGTGRRDAASTWSRVRGSRPCASCRRFNRSFRSLWILNFYFFFFWLNKNFLKWFSDEFVLQWVGSWMFRLWLKGVTVEHHSGDFFNLVS